MEAGQPRGAVIWLSKVLFCQIGQCVLIFGGRILTT